MHWESIQRIFQFLALGVAEDEALNQHGYQIQNGDGNKIERIDRVLTHSVELKARIRDNDHG